MKEELKSQDSMISILKWMLGTGHITMQTWKHMADSELSDDEAISIG